MVNERIARTRGNAVSLLGLSYREPAHAPYPPASQRSRHACAANDGTSLAHRSATQRRSLAPALDSAALPWLLRRCSPRD